MYTVKINCNQVMRLTGHLRLFVLLLMVSQVLGRWEHALGQRLRKGILLQIQQKDGFLDIYCRFIWGIPFRVYSQTWINTVDEQKKIYPGNRIHGLPQVTELCWENRFIEKSGGTGNAFVPISQSFWHFQRGWHHLQSNWFLSILETKLDGFYHLMIWIRRSWWSWILHNFSIIHNTYSTSPQSLYVQIDPPCSKWSYLGTQVPGSSQVANRVHGILNAQNSGTRW